MDGRRITIDGKRWRLRYVPLRDADGLCDPPTKANKEIRLGRRLLRYPRRRAEILTHEILHASLWSLTEEVVGQIADDLIRILEQEGCLKTE